MLVLVLVLVLVVVLVLLVHSRINAPAFDKSAAKNYTHVAVEPDGTAATATNVVTRCP